MVCLLVSHEPTVRYRQIARSFAVPDAGCVRVYVILTHQLLPVVLHWELLILSGCSCTQTRDKI